MTVDKALDLIDQNLAKVPMSREAHNMIFQVLREVKKMNEEENAQPQKKESKNSVAKSVSANM